MQNSNPQSSGKTWAQFEVYRFYYSYSKLHVRKHYKTQICRNPTSTVQSNHGNSAKLFKLKNFLNLSILAEFTRMVIYYSET